MQQASDPYGIHVLISAAKYLDRMYGYSRLTLEQRAYNPLHKAMGVLTDRMPETVFNQFWEDRIGYQVGAPEPPRVFKITYYEKVGGYKVSIPNYDGGYVVEARAV